MFLLVYESRENLTKYFFFTKLVEATGSATCHLVKATQKGINPLFSAGSAWINRSKLNFTKGLITMFDYILKKKKKLFIYDVMKG